MNNTADKIITNTIRYSLFDQYFKELAKYDKKCYPSREEVFEWYQDYTNNGYTWIDLKYKDRIVGFIIIAEKGKSDDVHPQCDYFIAQTYVMPLFRLNGICMRAISDFISTHRGKYCLLVIRTNEKAKIFWEKVIIRNHGRKIKLRDYGYSFETEEEIGFEVRK